MQLRDDRLMHMYGVVLISFNRDSVLKFWKVRQRYHCYSGSVKSIKSQCLLKFKLLNLNLKRVSRVKMSIKNQDESIVSIVKIGQEYEEAR